MMRYDGQQVTGMLPMTAVACGTASLPLADQIAARRNQMIAAREKTIAHVKSRGLNVLPGSHANMFMVEWKDKTPKEMQDASLPTTCRSAVHGQPTPNVARHGGFGRRHAEVLPGAR